MRSVIFDLDGTLADSAADMIAAANAALAPRGAGDLLHPRHDAATAFRGGRAMLRLGLGRAGGEWSEADVDAYFPDLLDAYEAAIDVNTRLYPGVAEAVEALRRADFRVGICTNKPERLAVILMERLGVRNLFGSLIGADTLPVKKPDPAPLHEAIRRAGGAPGRSLMIGDTLTDRTTGRNAGIPVALVTFGPDGHGVGELEPEATLDRYADLPELAERLVPA